MPDDVSTQVGRLLEAVDGLRGDVDRVEKKIDLSARDEDVKRVEVKVDQAASRVRKLELWKAGLTGAILLLAWLVVNNVDPNVVHQAIPAMP